MSASISTGCTATDGREGSKGSGGDAAELQDPLATERPLARKSAPADGYLDSRLEGELKKDLTLSTIDLLLFGLYSLSASGQSSKEAFIVSNWIYGEPRAEGFKPVGLLGADPTFEVAPDEHSEAVASGGAVWARSSSGLKTIRLRVCNAGAEVEVGSSSSHDCVKTITVDGRSFLCLTFLSVEFGLELAEYRETGGPQ